MREEQELLYKTNQDLMKKVLEMKKKDKKYKEE